MTFQVQVIDYDGERIINCASLDQALEVVDVERVRNPLGWKKVELRVDGQPRVYWATVSGGGMRRVMVRTPKRTGAYAKTVLERNGRCW